VVVLSGGPDQASVARTVRPNGEQDRDAARRKDRRGGREEPAPASNAATDLPG